jgi:hypothetical protein
MYPDIRAVFKYYRGGQCSAFEGPGNRCRRELKFLAEKHTRAFDINFARRPDILTKLFDMLSGESKTWETCSACRIRIQEKPPDSPRYIWEDLKRTFDLEQ